MLKISGCKDNELGEMEPALLLAALGESSLRLLNLKSVL